MHFLFGSLLSQESTECAFTESTTIDPSGYTYSTNPDDLASYAPRVYNVYFWVIKKDDGSGNTTITENKILQGIANLNITFNQFNIFFKYRGNGTLNKTEHIVWENTSEFTTMLNYAKSIGANKPDMFNVYIPREAQGFGGIAERYVSTNLGVSGGNVASPTLINEMGHCFNLRHLDSGGSNCENVTRDPNDPNFNAYDTGDRVADTPATRHLNTSDVDPNNCTYIGTYTDCSVPVAQQYQILEPDVRNFLMRGTYIDATTCKKEYFTTGQGFRMADAILVDEATNGGVFTAAETSVASLYEPYSGEYYVSGPSTSTLPLFQPGFDYHFVTCNCDCSQPSPYGDSFSWSVSVHDKIISKYETDYSTIYHPNHTAIIINSFQNTDLVYLDPQRCYDNDSMFASDGLLTRFNDDVFNANVTITPQDSTSINNPNLIDDLPNGLYSIEKNYIDGTTKQTVIQKGNN
ncbi:hypothetical protein [Rasiella sp. SM2506]|uniref:hypothetical protein n=1 Tax=Rasiella sp. SM2506 TaxID=3423914 RepID=UPI003D79B59E